MSNWVKFQSVRKVEIHFLEMILPRFKFINGNTWEQAEVVPESCSELVPWRIIGPAFGWVHSEQVSFMVFHTCSKASNNFNRYISVGSDGAPEEIHVCFGACLPCGQLPACNSAAWHIFPLARPWFRKVISVKQRGSHVTITRGAYKNTHQWLCATFGLLTGKQFNCPAGFALKPSALNHAGESQVGRWGMMGRVFFKWFLPDMAWIYEISCKNCSTAWEQILKRFLMSYHIWAQGVGAITSIDGIIWVTKQDCMDLISWC